MGLADALLLGAPFGVLALYLRLRINESPAYEQVSSSDAGRLRPAAISAHSGGAVEADGDLRGRVVTSQAPDCMLTGYMPTYLKVVVHVGKTAGREMNVAT